jgi:flagellar biosynthesis/type III secretory pathway M-ring protein FliF/YscJ
MMMKKQPGFGVAELVLIVLFIGVVAFAGYFVMNRNKNQENVNAPAPVVQQDDEIKNEQDLQAAEDSLNDTSIDELDTSELDQIEQELL